MGIEANQLVDSSKVLPRRKHEIVSGGEILAEDASLVHWRCKQSIQEGSCLGGRLHLSSCETSETIIYMLLDL